MSSITYNSVTIEDVLLQTLDMSPVYDEEGGGDPIGIRTTVVVRGVLHAGTNSQVRLGHQVGAKLGSANAALSRLSAPRKRFLYQFGPGDVLFDVSPSAVTPGTGQEVFGGISSDLNNGPRPFVRVDRVVGAKSMHVTFGVEFMAWDCSNAKAVTNLRYYCTEDIDQDWYRSRTFQGRLRLRSRVKHPHAFRNFVLPPLQGGFKRERMSFQESPDGLSLRFQIFDREMKASAPYPATSWRGSFRVATHDGASVVEAVDVTMRAPPNVAKNDLLKVAFKIIDTKLNVLARRGSEEVPIVIESAEFSESLTDNEVTASMRIRHAKDPLTRLLAITNNNFGSPLPPQVALDGKYDHTRHRVPLLPDSLAGLFTSAMQDPCFPSGLAGVQIDVQEETEEPEEEGEPQDQDEDGQAGDVLANLLNAEEQRNIYTDYRISSEVKQNSGVRSFPLAYGPGKETVAGIQFHKGYAIREIRVDAERLGHPPTLPAPKTFTDPVNKIGHALIDHSIEAMGAKLAPDGVSKIHHVTMFIRYALSRPLTENDRVYGATMPYDLIELESNMLPAEIFRPSGNNGALV